MHAGKRYSVFQTLRWSKWELATPMVWGAVVTVGHEIGGATWLSIPWLPMSVLGVAVAFYIGFQNNASYDRLWEGRKIYGAIVNASRSWTYSVRDMVVGAAGADVSAVHRQMMLRHVAWMDALRHQLRRVKVWEHSDTYLDDYRLARVIEYSEDLHEVLIDHVGKEEADEVMAQINPAAHLIANQSRQLAELRRDGHLDGFGHMVLQQLLHELMTQQGKAERIKNFPFPRQYATVNNFFVGLFCLFLPMGMIAEFANLGEGLAWLTIPFSGMVSWVFLTADKIGDWSENPFEGGPNDVPITAMSRGIERDIRQMVGQQDNLPEPRPVQNEILM